MLELVRYQKQELPLVAGMEEVMCSAEDVMKSERRNRREQGKIADLPVYTISYPKIKKIAAIKDHIWGL